MVLGLLLRYFPVADVTQVLHQLLILVAQQNAPRRGGAVRAGSRALQSRRRDHFRHTARVVTHKADSSVNFARVQRP